MEDDYPELVFRASLADLEITHLHMDRILLPIYEPIVRSRVPPLYPMEEFFMENYIFIEKNFTFREVN